MAACMAGLAGEVAAIGGHVYVQLVARVGHRRIEVTVLYAGGAAAVKVAGSAGLPTGHRPGHRRARLCQAVGNFHALVLNAPGEQ